MSNNFQARLKQTYQQTRELFNVNWIQIDISDKSIQEVIPMIRHVIKI